MGAYSMKNVWFVTLWLLLVGCHLQVSNPFREGTLTATRECVNGACMPTHPLEIYVGVPASREVRITLMNPHGEEEECTVREQDGNQIANCAYPIVNGFAAPYYLLVTVSPAHTVQTATCAIDPTLMHVLRWDRANTEFVIERVSVSERGPCVYIVRERVTVV